MNLTIIRDNISFIMNISFYFILKDLFICVFICLCMSICVHKCVYLCMWMPKEVPSVLPILTSVHLGQGLFLNLGLRFSQLSWKPAQPDKRPIFTSFVTCYMGVGI